METLAERTPKLMNVNVDLLTKKVITGLIDGVKTSDLDLYAAECAAEQTSSHVG